MVLQPTYNVMYAMNNNQQQSHQTNKIGQLGSNSKSSIGRLMTKYERRKEMDDEQDMLITRKKIVYPGNCLNYSQIYSDIRISRIQKLSSTKQLQNFEKRHIQNSTKMISNQQINPSLVYYPKSLPKIIRNAKLNSQLDAPRWDKNASQTLEKAISQTRHKSFSITHYDIYKPKLDKKISLQHNSNKQKQEHSFIKNSSYISSSNQQQSENIYVKFQQTTKDMPEPHQTQFQSSQSISALKKQVLEAEQPDLAIRHLQEQDIRVESKVGSIRKAKEIKKSMQQLLIRIQQKEREEVNIKAEQHCERGNAIFKQSSQNNKIIENHQTSTYQRPQVEQYISQDSLKKSSEHILQLDVPIIPNQPKVHSQVPQHRKSQQKTPKMPDHNNKQKEFIKESHQSQDLIDNNDYRNHKKQNLKQSILQVNPVTENRQLGKQKDYCQVPVQINKNSASDLKTIVKELVQQGPQKGQKDSKNSQSDIYHKAGSKNKQLESATNSNEMLKESFHSFSLQDYSRVHDILKKIQFALRTPQVDVHSLIRQIKGYLEIIACGGLDHVDGYEMPLHRIKIIKNALLFQRIAVVVICLAFAVKKMQQTLKYLINLIIYTTSSNLLILKILQSCQITSDGSKNALFAKSDRLVQKRNFDTVRNNNDVILDAIFKISKCEQTFHESFKDIFKSIGKNSLQQTFYNVLQFFAFFLCVSDLHNTIPFLAIAPNPYLRDTIDNRPTLVIDVVQIFCHGTRKSKSYVFRPYTEHFLNEMAQYYEIVSFTSAYPNQIDRVIDILDPKKHIKHRLYKHHTIMKNNSCYKDTQRIGRDLRGLLLLDSEINFLSGELNNTILIPSWRGSKSDTTLAELCPILAAISIKRLDCRQATKKIYQQQLKNESAGIKYLNFGLNLQ